MQRKRLRVTPLLWLCLAAVMALVLAGLGYRWLRTGAAYPGLPVDVPLAADKNYGVSVDLTALSDEQLEHELERMSQLGLCCLRQPFRWTEIEPSPGNFEWAPLDRVVDAADRHGLSIIAVLDTTPSWARPAGSPSTTPPTELIHLGEFAGELAARYSGRVLAYQIWDEPNLSAHWGDQYVDPAAYALLLREVAIYVRQRDDQAIILTAALAPTLENGPLNLSDVAFLDGLYAANAAPWFDVVTAQPYGFEWPPETPAGSGRLDFARVELLRRVMEAHGDANTPIWLAAFGWAVAPAGQPTPGSPWPEVSPEQQQVYTAQAIQLARADWSWLGTMIFPAWNADLLPAGDPRRGLALTTGDRLSPAGVALTAATGQPAVATLGVYPADSVTGDYQGAWQVTSAGADVPRQPPARLNVRFEGTRIDLTVRRGTFKGFLYVSVDGKPANRLPQQTGRSYLVLYDPLHEQDTVTLARYLPDGPHDLVIEAEGGWYQWPIVGWRVSREADTRGLEAVLLLAGLAFCAAVYRTWRTTDVDHLWTVVDRVRPGIRSLDWRLRLLLLAFTALLFYLAPGTLWSAVAALPLFLVLLAYPEYGLLLTAFSLPFFLLPKSLIGRTVSMTELSLIFVSLAYVVRRALFSLRRRPLWLDWGSFAMAVLAGCCGLLTFIPLSGLGLDAGDWATAVLMLIPPAGVLAAAARHVTWRRESPSAGTAPAGSKSLVRQMDLAMAGLVALGLLAALAAGNVGVSFHEFHVVFWDAVAFYALIRLAGTECRSGRETPLSGRFSSVLVVAFLAGASIMAGYAIFQYFFTRQTIDAEGVRRALGVYGSPNNLALLLGRVVPILISLLLFSGASARSRLRVVLLAVVLAVNGLALLLTFSRGALLLGLPAALLFFGFVRGRRVLGLTLAVLAAAAGGVVPLLGTERLRSLLDTRNGTGFFRLRLWQSAWNMLREHPWLGVGPDNFLYQYRTRYLLPDAWQEPNLSHPHNILLDFGTRLGVSGIVLLIWIQVTFWRLAARLYRRLAEGPQRALILGLMGSMVASLAHGLVDNSIFLVDLAFIFVMTLAVVTNGMDS